MLYSKAAPLKALLEGGGTSPARKADAQAVTQSAVGHDIALLMPTGLRDLGACGEASLT